MSANFYAAILSFTVTCAGTLALGIFRQPANEEQGTAGGLVRVPVWFTVPTVVWALVLVAACVAFNELFW
jgi:hypothetical protein